jgi:hypothetical protein
VMFMVNILIKLAINQNRRIYARSIQENKSGY